MEAAECDAAPAPERQGARGGTRQAPAAAYSMFAWGWILGEALQRACGRPLDALVADLARHAGAPESEVTPGGVGALESRADLAQLMALAEAEEAADAEVAEARKGGRTLNGHGAGDSGAAGSAIARPPPQSARAAQSNRQPSAAVAADADAGDLDWRTAPGIARLELPALERLSTIMDYGANHNLASDDVAGGGDVEAEAEEEDFMGKAQRVASARIRDALEALVDDEDQRRALQAFADESVVPSPHLADPRVWNSEQLRAACVPAVNAHASARALCTLLDSLVTGSVAPRAQTDAALAQPAVERDWLAAMHELMGGDADARLAFAAGFRLFDCSGQPGSGGEGSAVEKDGAYGMASLLPYTGHLALTHRASGVSIVILCNKLHTPALDAMLGGPADGATSEAGLSDERDRDATTPGAIPGAAVPGDLVSSANTAMAAPSAAATDVATPGGDTEVCATESILAAVCEDLAISTPRVFTARMTHL